MSFDFNNWQDWLRGRENSQNRNQRGGQSNQNQRGSGFGYNRYEEPEVQPNQRRTVVEEIQANGQNLVEQVQRLLNESNVRRVRIKKDGRVMLDIPVAAALIGGLLAPSLAALGGIAAVATNCTIEVTRDPNAAVQTKRPQTEPQPRPTDRYDDVSYR